jgi:hypothetical protein
VTSHAPPCDEQAPSNDAGLARELFGDVAARSGGERDAREHRHELAHLAGQQHAIAGRVEREAIHRHHVIDGDPRVAGSEQRLGRALVAHPLRAPRRS